MKTAAKKQQHSEQLAPQPGTNLVAMLQQAAELEHQVLVLAHENEGEIDGQLDALLSGLTAQVVAKTDAYKYVMDRLETSAGMLKQKADQIYTAAGALDRAAKRMEDNLKGAMLGLNVKELAGDTWRFVLSPTRGRLTLDADQMQKLENELREKLGDLIEHVRTYRDKNRTADAGGAGKELAALCKTLDELDALEASAANAVRLEIVLTPDKELLRKLVDAGTPVLGAQLEPGYSLRPYVNKTQKVGAV